MSIFSVLTFTQIQDQNISFNLFTCSTMQKHPYTPYTVRVDLFLYPPNLSA